MILQPNRARSQIKRAEHPSLYNIISAVYSAVFLQLSFNGDCLTHTTHHSFWRYLYINRKVY